MGAGLSRDPPGSGVALAPTFMDQGFRTGAMQDVLVVEDDPILRDLLVEEMKRLPGAEVACVRSAASLAEARRFLAQAPPALVLLDVRLPDGSGLDLVQGLLDLRPEVRIVVLSGCPALLEPSLSLLPQLHAVLSKAEGLAPLRDALQALVQEFDPTSPDIASLSPRQLEMLLLIGEGLDTSEIAERLGISLATAQTHRRQITGRLGVKGTRLITFARSLALNRA